MRWKIRWFTWAAQSRMEMELPKQYDIQKIAPGVSPEKLLIEGELDAVIQNDGKQKQRLDLRADCKDPLETAH